MADAADCCDFIIKPCCKIKATYVAGRQATLLAFKTPAHSMIFDASRRSKVRYSFQNKTVACAKTARPAEAATPDDCPIPFLFTIEPAGGRIPCCHRLLSATAELVLSRSFPDAGRWLVHAEALIPQHQSEATLVCARLTSAHSI